MNLDTLYFRNRDIIAAQQNPRCSGYKSLRVYALCSEEQQKTTKMEARDFDYKYVKPEKPKAGAATPAATPAPAATESFMIGV